MRKIAKTGIVGSFWLLVLSCGGDSEPLNPSGCKSKKSCFGKTIECSNLL